MISPEEPLAAPPIDLLARLDPAQREAVTCSEHPLAVIAAAGSGKTSVLTRRIARRVLDGEAEERHVVALTFSREAARELTRRLGALGVRGVTSGTFHAVAYGVLRQRWADLGRPAPALITARARLLTDAAAAVTGTRRAVPPHELGGELDWSRARRIDAASYPLEARAHARRTSASPTAIAQAIAAYAALKQRRRVIDFDDLLEFAVLDAERDPEFGAQVRWRFRHFFVDEFQDVNPLQHDLLRVWLGGRRDLCVVGDPRQAIYGWNGSDPSLLARVDETFPGIRIVRLQRNYRCAPEIVEAAASVLAADDGADDVVGVRPPIGRVRLVGAADERGEAAMVADQLRRRHGPGSRWRSFAVLARTNAQLEPIRDALAARSIPFTIAGRTDELVDDPARRALLTDARRAVAPSTLAAWGRDLDDGTDEVPASALHRQLAEAVRRFLSSVPDGGGQAFVEWFELAGDDPSSVSAGSSHGVGRDAVALLTFHGAKGREWPTVFVVGIEPGLVPHGGASTPEARAEETRLLYVAVTRAADDLVVSWCEQRAGRVTGRSDALAFMNGDAGDDAPRAVPAEIRLRLRSMVATPPGGPGGEAPDERFTIARAALLRWRTAAAKAAGLPEAAICDDAVLELLARSRPGTIDEVAAVPGMGVLAAQRLGPRVLDVLATARSTGTPARRESG